LLTLCPPPLLMVFLFLFPHASMTRGTCFLTLTSIFISLHWCVFILFARVLTDSASCYFYNESQTYSTRRSSQRWLVANMCTYIHLRPSLLCIMTAKKNLCMFFRRRSLLRIFTAKKTVCMFFVVFLMQMSHLLHQIHLFQICRHQL